MPMRLIPKATLAAVLASGLLVLTAQRAEASLIGLYTFDDPTNLGLDSSGNNNDLVVVGSVASSAGTIGGGLLLNGNGFLSTLSGNAPMGLPVGSSSYTISLDFQTASGDASGGMIGWGNYGNVGEVNALRTSNEASIPNQYGVHNYWWNNDITAEPLSVGDVSWHNVVATYDAATGLRQLYVDQVLLATDAPGVPNVGIGQFTLGSTLNGGENFSGTLDNVAVYDVPLAAILEPASLVLLGTGLAGCGLIRRKAA